MSLSLHTLPLEITYRILDHLNNSDLFKVVVISQRLHTIVNSYKPYQVKIIEIQCHNCKILFIGNNRSLFESFWTSQ